MLCLLLTSCLAWPDDLVYDVEHGSVLSSKSESHSLASGVNARWLASGDPAHREQAWRALYRENFTKVYRLIRQYGVAESELEDLTQKTFLILHRRIEEGAQIDNVGGWIRGTAVRVVAGHRRWKRVRDLARPRLWLERMSKQVGQLQIDDLMESSERARVIRDAVARLSPKLQDVIVLTELESVPVEEAAKILGVPPNTVRSRRARGRERLKQMLSAQAPEPPEGRES